MNFEGKMISKPSVRVCAVRVSDLRFHKVHGRPKKIDTNTMETSLAPECRMGWVGSVKRKRKLGKGQGRRFSAKPTKGKTSKSIQDEWQFSTSHGGGKFLTLNTYSL